MDILRQIRERGHKKILFSLHATRQMSKPDRMITPKEVRKVIEEGLLIEDYPDDERGHSCLIFGKGAGGRHIHVVCSPKEEYLCIITAYLPLKENWIKSRKRR